MNSEQAKLLALTGQGEKITHLKGGVMKWISVGERLPAYGDDCLIVAEGKSEPENIVYEFTKNKFSSEGQFVSIPGGEDYFYARNVSFWMPLPAAPEQTK